MLHSRVGCLPCLQTLDWAGKARQEQTHILLIWANRPPGLVYFCTVCLNVNGNAVTFTLTTLSIMTFSILTISIMTFSILTIIILTFSTAINEIWHSVIKHNNTQHNGTQCIVLLCWLPFMLSVANKYFMLSVIILSAIALASEAMLSNCKLFSTQAKFIER
jgi:hypothetical protein